MLQSKSKLWWMNPRGRGNRSRDRLSWAPWDPGMCPPLKDPDLVPPTTMRCRPTRELGYYFAASIDASQGASGAMNLICWNWRGVRRSLYSNKMQYLANWMSLTNANVTFILETLSSKINSRDFGNRFPSFDICVVPAEGWVGGLWVMLVENIKLDRHQIL